jgi:myosin I
VAYLLEVEASQVDKVLTSKVVETQRGGRRGRNASFPRRRYRLTFRPGSVYDVPLNPAQASSGRDALAKAIYNNLFEWIVARINVSMKPRQAHARLIGILVRGQLELVLPSFETLTVLLAQRVCLLNVF